jgi:hypothetical protein
LVNRELLAQLRDLPSDVRFDVSITQVVKHIADPTGERPALLPRKASRRHRRRAYPQPGSHERRLGIIRHCVFVDRDAARTGENGERQLSARSGRWQATVTGHKLKVTKNSE